MGHLTRVYFLLQLEYERKKKEEGKRARADKQQVLDMLFSAFEKHQYYNIKDLVDITKQPVVRPEGIVLLYWVTSNKTCICLWLFAVIGQHLIDLFLIFVLLRSTWRKSCVILAFIMWKEHIRTPGSSSPNTDITKERKRLTSSSCPACGQYTNFSIRRDPS